MSVGMVIEFVEYYGLAVDELIAFALCTIVGKEYPRLGIAEVQP